MSAYQAPLLSNEDIEQIKQTLAADGWILLRGRETDSNTFSHMMQQLCGRLTFDPARQYITEATQKVDAGTGPVGLHIENGNTPLQPDIVAFFSKRSAKKGSQSTVCDGAEMWKHMSPALQKKFSQKITVTRTLPEVLWKRYVATALDIETPESVTFDNLETFLTKVSGQKAELFESGELRYELTLNPVLNENMSSKTAFANAILGPSYNYEAPEYQCEDGTDISQELIDELKELAEQFTHEVQWQDGDIVVIDNKRVMHGRRAIVGPLSERELFIGMGDL